MKKRIECLKDSHSFSGLIAIGLGIIFENQNIAFMVGLAFAIAASTNFLLFFYPCIGKITTHGAFYGGIIGLVTTIALVILSPVVWVDVFQFPTAIFPYKILLYFL